MIVFCSCFIYILFVIYCYLHCKEKDVFQKVLASRSGENTPYASIIRSEQDGASEGESGETIVNSILQLHQQINKSLDTTYNRSKWVLGFIVFILLFLWLIGLCLVIIKGIPPSNIIWQEPLCNFLQGIWLILDLASGLWEVP